MESTKPDEILPLIRCNYRSSISQLRCHIKFPMAETPNTSISIFTNPDQRYCDLHNQNSVENRRKIIDSLYKNSVNHKEITEKHSNNQIQKLGDYDDHFNNILDSEAEYVSSDSNSESSEIFEDSVLAEEPERLKNLQETNNLSEDENEFSDDSEKTISKRKDDLVEADEKPKVKTKIKDANQTVEAPAIQKLKQLKKISIQSYINDRQTLTTAISNYINRLHDYNTITHLSQVNKNFHKIDCDEHKTQLQIQNEKRKAGHLRAHLRKIVLSRKQKMDYGLFTNKDTAFYAKIRQNIFDVKNRTISANSVSPFIYTVCKAGNYLDHRQNVKIPKHHSSKSNANTNKNQKSSRDHEKSDKNSSNEPKIPCLFSEMVERGNNRLPQPEYSVFRCNVENCEKLALPTTETCEFCLPQVKMKTDRDEMRRNTQNQSKENLTLFDQNFNEKEDDDDLESYLFDKIENLDEDIIAANDQNCLEASKFVTAANDLFKKTEWESISDADSEKSLPLSDGVEKSPTESIPLKMYFGRKCKRKSIFHDFEMTEKAKKKEFSQNFGENIEQDSNHLEQPLTITTDAVQTASGVDGFDAISMPNSISLSKSATPSALQNQNITISNKNRLTPVPQAKSIISNISASQTSLNRNRLYMQNKKRNMQQNKSREGSNIGSHYENQSRFSHYNPPNMNYSGSRMEVVSPTLTNQSSHFSRIDTNLTMTTPVGGGSTGQYSYNYPYDLYRCETPGSMISGGASVNSENFSVHGQPIQKLEVAVFGNEIVDLNDDPEIIQSAAVVELEPELAKFAMREQTMSTLMSSQSYKQSLYSNSLGTPGSGHHANNNDVSFQQYLQNKRKKREKDRDRPGINVIDVPQKSDRKGSKNSSKLAQSDIFHSLDKKVAKVDAEKSAKRAARKRNREREENQSMYGGGGASNQSNNGSSYKIRPVTPDPMATTGMTKTPIKTPLSSKVSNGSNKIQINTTPLQKPSFANLLSIHKNKQNLKKSPHNLPSSLSSAKSRPFYIAARAENLIIETGPGSPFKTAYRDRNLMQGICCVEVPDVLRSGALVEIKNKKQLQALISGKSQVILK